MEKKLVDTLSCLFGNRVWPDIAPIDTEKPFCIWQQVGGNAVKGVASERKIGRIQITVWAETREESMSLIRQVENLLVSEPVCATVVLGAQAVYDDDTGLRGAMQDFSIWI